jgi:hypothetical protein
MSAHATTTYLGRVKRALAFKALTLWFGMGRSATPWPDENNPPSPAPGDSDISEALFFAKPEVKSLCRPLSQGDWELLAPDARVPRSINGVYYALVADVDAYDEIARWVYLRGVMDVELSHPAGTFRQTAVFSDLVPDAGYEAATWLLPVNVDDRGSMEWIDNNKPKTIDLTENRCTTHVVIEFR